MLFRSIMPLIRVQSGRNLSWIWARCIAVGLIAAAAGLFLVLLAASITAAGAVDSLILAVLVVAYVAMWTGLLVVVSVVSRNPSQGAVALGTMWIILCVLVPAVGVERSAALAADDFALDLTVEARHAKRSAGELEEDAIMETVVSRFPELADLNPERNRTNLRAARGALRLVGLEERMQQREERGRAQRKLVSSVSIAAPTVAFTHALESLAGRGPQVAEAFRHAVTDAVAARVEHVLAATWRGRPLGAEDFNELVDSTPSEITPLSPTWLRELGIIVAWALGLFGCAGVLGRRLGG